MHWKLVVAKTNIKLQKLVLYNNQPGSEASMFLQTPELSCHCRLQAYVTLDMCCSEGCRIGAGNCVGPVRRGQGSAWRGVYVSRHCVKDTVKHETCWEMDVVECGYNIIVLLLVIH